MAFMLPQFYSLGNTGFIFQTFSAPQWTKSQCQTDLQYLEVKVLIKLVGFRVYIATVAVAV